MGAANLEGVEAASVHKILCLLDALRQSRTGSVIYRQVASMLDDIIDSQQVAEQAYITLVNQLLEVYVNHLTEGSPLQVQVRVLQARLQPPLTPADLVTLKDYVDLYAGQIESLKRLDADLFQEAIDPLLQSFGIVDELVEPVNDIPPEPQSIESDRVQQPGVISLNSGEDVRDIHDINSGSYRESEWPFTEPPDTGVPDDVKMVVRRGTGSPIEDDSADTETPGDGDENAVDPAYRSQLDSKRKDIQKLQNNLAQQVLETISQNEEFGVLLEVVLGELRQTGNGEELEDLRWTLIREIEKLTRGHHELADKLDSTHHYLQLVESDSRQLNDELTRVRLLSLTDELTGLPNRRAFLRRIEDEVARVQRYGFPLSLALIDLDHFKQVNDKYGHGGGDEVLQLYSRNILSIFRHHDLVARYGGEEFAVLLPNTEAEGALRALTKVRNRALETRWQANGEMISVPTFSSGVSLYKPGETASAFIERADKALYRAKRLGRNRVEMDATYQSDAGVDVPAADTGGTEQSQES